MLNHLAAFLMTLTIGATPVANLACVESCSGDTDAAIPECHLLLPVARDANDNCVGLLTQTPFLREETQPIVGSAMPASAPPMILAVEGEAELAAVRDVVPVIFHGPTPLHVLRL